MFGREKLSRNGTELLASAAGRSPSPLCNMAQTCHDAGRILLLEILRAWTVQLA
jgi:hypothetical protein